MEVVDGDFYEGSLLKKGHIRKNWKWRWFRLQNGNLAYFANSMETMPLGMLQLASYTLRLVPSQLRPYAFLLEPLKPGLSSFHICAMSADSCRNWVNKLQKYTIPNSSTTAQPALLSSSSSTNSGKQLLSKSNNNLQVPSDGSPAPQRSTVTGARPRSIAGSNPPPHQVLQSVSSPSVLQRDNHEKNPELDLDEDDVEETEPDLGPEGPLEGNLSQKLNEILDAIPEDVIQKDTEVMVNTKEMQSIENERLINLQSKYLSQRDPFKIYQLKETLGTGSVGEVVFGVTSEGQKVAIKKLKIIKKGKNRLPFILREIEIIATSQNENIVKYIESFQMASEELWVVMEYMSGGSLYDMLKLYPSGFRFTEGEVAYIIRETLGAVTYLHSMNRLHRDIKVDNILFSKEGAVKLADFGTAIQLQRNIKRTTLVGTPYYMAPELIRRQPYDSSVDVWSIGVTVVELMEGEPPFYELDPQQALSAIVESQGLPEKVGLTGKNYSTVMKDFVNSNCLQFEPAKRNTSFGLLKHPFISKACSKQDFSKKVCGKLKETEKNECVLF